MRTRYSIFAFSAILSFGLIAGNAGAVETDAAAMQFNNLTVKQVINDNGFKTIVGEAPGNCIRFRAVDSSIGSTVPCPVGSTPTYSIRVDGETKLLLRTREPAQVGDFISGDKINVYGLWSDVFSAKDGAIQGLLVRNISRPEEKRHIQLDNVELVGTSATTTPATLIVFQRGIYPCYDFGVTGAAKRPFPCPAGMSSFSSHPAGKNLSMTYELETASKPARKFAILVTSATQLQGRTRGPLSLSDLHIGDALNVYGVLENDGATIEAEIIRDLTRAPSGNGSGGLSETYEGIINQIYSGGERVSLRLRDGRVVTMDNPFTAGAFVRVKGFFDTIEQNITRLTDVQVTSREIQRDLPVIFSINPGSGPAGTRVTIKGTGFSPVSNDINFANVPGAVRGLAAPDRSTLTFVIPSTVPCPKDVFCPNTKLEPTIYPVSVSNASGTSESAKFHVIASQPFSIFTNELPQAVQNQRYRAEIEALGGVSYTWNIINGTLPPGLSFSQPTCIFAPCRDKGVIEGVPTVAGSYPITVSVRSEGETVSKNFTLTVIQAISSPF